MDYEIQKFISEKKISILIEKVHGLSLEIL